MKRTPVLLAAAALLAGGLGTDAMAAATKAPAPKPVTTTWYLHGGSANGNSDLLQGVPNGESGYLPMDAKAPTGTSAKEMLFFGALASPNSQCTGGPLLPSWTGTASGMLQGKVSVTFFARSTPGNAVIRILNVADAGCNASYSDPIAEATVALPASPTAVPVTVSIPIPKPAKLLGALSLQILQGQTNGLEGPQISGVSYDSTATPSKVTWTCLPKAGKKAC